MTKCKDSSTFRHIRPGISVSSLQCRLLWSWDQARGYRNRQRRKLEQGCCIRITPMFWERVMKECEDALVEEGIVYRSNRGWWFIGVNRG